MASYWLFKTEPDEYSFDDLVVERRTVWDGVSNNLALANMRKIKKGDQVLIYHTGNERAVIGVAEVLGARMKDQNDVGKNKPLIEIKPVRKLPRSITLNEIKDNTTFENFDLLKIPRLSVMPVERIHWKTILGMSGL